MRLLRQFVVAVISIALAYAALRLGLNYSGFCLEQRRYLSDSEMIEIAIERLLRSYPPTLIELVTYPDGRSAHRWFTPERALPYRSVQEFLAVNPDCCEVTMRENPKLGGDISLGMRLLGKTAANVRVRYQVRFLDANGQTITEYVEPYVAISNCGRPRV
jgi:hypothetical protein